MPRILILTAGFGEGHNTAARCSADALRTLDPSAEVRVLDPLAEVYPTLTRLTASAYLGIINHWPRLWQWFYTWADQAEPAGEQDTVLRAARDFLAAELESFRPDVVATTYPLYVRFWAALFPEPTPPPCPLVTVVTDSITVNAIWTRGRSTLWCVTDAITAGRLEDLGVDPGRIRVTGFPVSPRLGATARQLEAPSADGTFRVLYFPIASFGHTKAVLSALASLPASPAWSCTVVLGKKKDLLRPLIHAAISRGQLPAGTEIIGWTDQIPELLQSHHLVLGKAGGATVHEARTAARPIAIHYMVPGQEEGNALLLENEQGGFFLRDITSLPALWQSLTADHFAGWSHCHKNLLTQAPADPAYRVARLLLDLTAPHDPQSAL